ncbi:MAG TPA: GNAT family N-acetyltransferase [Candidatus Limnocylindria bacterium]
MRVRWFDPWSSEVDAALLLLPEPESCPHDLLAELMQGPTRTRKRTAIITLRGEPVAVVGLRSRKHFWEPVFSASVCPRAKMPARDGMLFPALAALGLDVWTGGWEDAPEGSLPNVRSAFSLPMYKVDCGKGAEEHWRQSGNARAVEIGRNRTRGFTLEVDAPGATEWVIENWGRQWRHHPSQETICVEDQLIAARYFQPRGLLHTFRLLDGGQPAAGYVGAVYRGEIVLVCGHREAEYERRSVGIRLFDLVIDWAAAAGYAKVDIGGGHAYKAKWAPEDGQRWYFNVCPTPLYVVKKAVRVARSSLSSFRNGAAGRATTAASAAGQ